MTYPSRTTSHGSRFRNRPIEHGHPGQRRPAPRPAWSSDLHHGIGRHPTPAHSGTDGDHQSGDGDDGVEDVLLAVDHQAERMVHGEAEQRAVRGRTRRRRRRRGSPTVSPARSDEHPEHHDAPDHVDRRVRRVAEQPARRVRSRPAARTSSETSALHQSRIARRPHSRTASRRRGIGSRRGPTARILPRRRDERRQAVARTAPARPGGTANQSPRPARRRSGRDGAASSRA